jgi:hypothetical protein
MPGSRALIAPSGDAENHSSAGRPCWRTDRRQRRVRGTPAPLRAPRRSRGGVCRTRGDTIGPHRHVRSGVSPLIGAWGRAAVSGGAPYSRTRALRVTGPFPGESPGYQLRGVWVARTPPGDSPARRLGHWQPPRRGADWTRPATDTLAARLRAARPRRPHTYPRPPSRVLRAGASRKRA